jgi:uncharacterized protein YkwD
MRALISLLLLSAGAQAAPGLPCMALDPEEKLLLEKINANRARLGRTPEERAPLKTDRRLTLAAEWMSRDMAATTRVEHVDSRGTDLDGRAAEAGYGRKVLAENIGAGSPLAESMLNGAKQSWMRSPPHRASILSGKYKIIGIARVYRPNDPTGMYWYWTTVFGDVLPEELDLRCDGPEIPLPERPPPGPKSRRFDSYILQPQPAPPPAGVGD